MGAFDDLVPNKSGSGAFDDLVPKNTKIDNADSFASKIRNYGLSTLAAFGSGAAELGSGIGSFLEAPAANTLSAIKSTGALLDRGYVDASNAIGKGDPNFDVKKYDQDIQEEAQRASRFAAESRAENVDSKYNVIAKTGQFLESGGRSLSSYIDNKIQENLPELVKQQQAISNANGAYDTTVESLKNPLAFSHTLVKSAPSLLLGLGAGRLVASRALSAGAGAGEVAAARVAAAGGDAAAQEVAAKTAIDAVQAQATRAASTAGIGSEAATSGLSSRESSYTQVKQTPFEKLSESPRFNELVKQTGDLEKSREMLANEVADSTPILSAGLTGLGTVVTNKLYGGDATAKVLSGVEKPGLKAVIKDISQEGAEEVIQGVPQGYSDHRAIQLADPNKEFDLGAEIAQNALGGIALGGAGHGAAYAKQKFSDARVGVADAIKNRYENNIAKTISPDTQIEPSDEVQLTEPEKALANPKVITPLDRVNEIDVNLKKLSPENGYGEVFDQERSDLLNERESILQSFPRLQEGAPTSFTTEDGAKLNGRYALIDANDLQTSHDIDLRENPNYPPELQPRERERAASAAQISGIVQKIDPARLGASADAGTGAPIIGADGLVESGNARSIALKRIYRVPGQKAEDYKAYLTANAAQFGIDPVQIEQLQNPVLVRVRDTPVDRAEFARQANAPTVARLSTVEQARADAKRLDVLDDLSPTDSGDFSNSTNFISRFVAQVPQTERSELVDADGKLSAAGYARVRNAVLAKAYGDSPVILRLTESLNDNLRNVSKALLQVAPKVAQVRASIKDGNLHDADITPDLLGAVEELSRIKDSGQSVSEYLNQNDIFGDNTSSESKELLQFLDENIRRPKQIAEFILRYNEALESIGNPKQADIFNDNSAPEKSDLLNLAKRDNNDQPIIEQGRNQESPVPAGQNVIERADQSSDQEGNRGDQAPAGGEGQGVIIADDRNDASLDRLDKNDLGKSRNGVEYNNQVVSSNPNSQPAGKNLETSISTPSVDGIAKDNSEVGTEEAVFKANSTAVLGFTVDALTSQVKDITDKWKNAPKTNVVETPSDLPFAAPSNARGAYYNGEIYLVASNIHSQQDAEIVLFHEALGHAGLRGAFGDSLIPSLRKLAIDNLSIAKAAANWRNENKGIRGKKTEDEWLTTSVEEVLANIAESGKPIKGFDQFLSKVQSALRAVGLNSVADWIAKHTNAEVARLLTGARKHIIDGNKSHVLAGEEAKAFSFDPNADKSAEAALEEISKIGDAFAYPKSESNTVEGITADIDSNIKVRKLTNIPGETRYEFTMPDLSTARMMVRPFNKYGKSIYGYELDANNEMTGQVDERPGKFPEEAHGKGDVWIDVSLLKEGKGYGAKLYQIAGNYAYNTGQVFIGDPAGISREALLRRPEQMLSSALKFGTTEHIAPHPIQIKGDKKNGIAPLDWVYGDHIGNIQKLIDATLQNIDNGGGIGGIEYDKRSGEFIDGTGASVTRQDLFGLAKAGLARSVQAGGRTLARYAFLKSILPAHGSGKQAGRQSGVLLVRLSQQLRNHVSTMAQNGIADPESKRIFYSRGRDGGELTQAMEEIDKKIAAAKEKYDKNKTPLTEGNLLDLLRKKEALINNQNKPAQEAKQKQEDDYRDSHKAPTVEDGAQGNDLTKVYPDDIYSAKAAQYYGDGSQLDKTTIKTVQSWRGKPNAEVTIYRAVPKDAPDTINTGDWVGINLEYAENHGDGPLNGDYKIVSKKVKVSEIYTNGDSIQEWGYHPSNDDVKFSLASNATNDQEALSRVGTVTERADAIIKQSAATPAPIDSVVKAAVKISQIDKVTGGIYDGAGFILDRYTPESIKAGFVSDYGVPEAVIDRRTVLSAHINVQTRKIGKFVDQLSSLTRQESRVAYEWLNNKDPQALQYFENQLPPESVAVLSDIKKTIDDLSKEAISLGQLSQEAYDKNAFEYLRRSYVKHTFEQYKGNEKKRARAISILGDQYKGRGLSEIASMQQIENIDPAWWNRKLQDGKADKQLKGEKFIRLEKHAASGEGTIPLEGIGDRPKGKLQSVVYYPANETIPTKYAEWSQAGTFEVRDVKGSNVILWRDFTKQEREKMGEIDEARYAIANTLHSMVNDIETARYLEWINKKYGFAHPEQVPGKIVEAKELSLTTFGTVYKPGDWVQVPDTKVQGTDVKKYGALAGKYIPGPIWNDIRQIGQGSFKPFGETYSTIQRFWKTSKTALSPAVHTNNVMANFVMADWHDVSAGHIYKALRILLGAHDRDGTGAIGRAGNAAARLGIVDRDAAKEILARYQDSGGNIGTYASKELQNEQIQPLLDAIEKEMAANGESPNAQVGVMNALQFLRHGEISAAYQAAIGSKPSKAISNEAKNLIALYQSEDDVFRLAAWLKAKEDGDTDIQAGKKSRKSFLDYNINAPWVAALRSTAFPFVAFSYRAIPMLAEIAAKRPWKILKLAAIAGGLNALGYALSGGDEDDERRYLPEEKAGRVWGMVPKLIRLGWNDEHDQPVFLDIRRFIPVGDIADVDQGHSALPIPPSMMPGGPLMLLGEAFLNKSSFTGKSITLETDTNFEKLIKTGDYLYKAVAPNIALLPGTYGYENITNAGKGKTDAFGRELSVNQALLNSVGIKVGSYGTDTLRVNAGKKLQAELSEIDANINSLSKEYSRKGLTYDEFIEKATKQQDKKKKIIEQFREK